MENLIQTMEDFRQELLKKVNEKVDEAIKAGVSTKGREFDLKHDTSSECAFVPVKIKKFTPGAVIVEYPDDDEYAHLLDHDGDLGATEEVELEYFSLDELYNLCKAMEW